MPKMKIVSNRNLQISEALTYVVVEWADLPDLIAQAVKAWRADKAGTPEKLREKLGADAAAFLLDKIPVVVEPASPETPPVEVKS